MKKILLLVALPLFLFSCVKNSKEYKELKAKNDSLMSFNSKKVAEVESYLQSLNEIAENFEKIKSAEKYVNTEASNDKLSEESVDQIAENVQLITDILERNREKITLLEEELKKSNGSNYQLKRALDRLNATLQDKTLAMDSLKNELALKDEKLFQLGKKVGNLTKENKVLVEDIETKTEKIKYQEDKMHTAWYVFGSKRELSSQKIISSTGLFSKPKILQSDFNKNYFVKIDIRSTTTIPLYSKNAKVLTNHPVKSYTMTTENGTKVLHVKDFVEFWSVSRYLVVQVD